MAVTRGARRFLRASGFAVLGELPLPNGRRADLVALAPDGALRIVEVKSSRADFQADRKWTDYRDKSPTLFQKASQRIAFNSASLEN